MIGHTVWSATRGRRGLDDGGVQIEPLGGIVVEVRPAHHGAEDHVEDVDDLPVAVMDFETFVVVDLSPSGRPVVRVLSGLELNPDAGAPPDLALVNRTARALAAELGYDVRSGRLVRSKRELSTRELHRVTYLHRLAAVIGSTRPPDRPAKPSYRDEPEVVFDPAVFVE